MSPNLDAVRARYSRALDAKPSKGEWEPDGIAAITDSVADIPDLLAEIQRVVASSCPAIRFTPAAAADVEELIHELTERAVAYRAKGRSSMPIDLDDAVALLAIAVNDPWTLPDGARIRTTVEGIVIRTRNPLSHDGAPNRTAATGSATPARCAGRGYTGAHIDLDNLSECVWEYWSEEAPEAAPEFVEGFEAAAAEGRWLVRRARLLGWLRVFALVGITLGVSSLATNWLGPLVLVAAALVSAVASVVAIVLGARITRMDREARRG